MESKELNNFKRLVKKVGSHKPGHAPKKPEKAPSTKQLKETYTLNKRNMTIKKG